MYNNIFTITPMDVITWITFGFVVGILVHSVRPSARANAFKDIILATLGSMIAGLSIVFFYGYPMLGTITTSIVAGIILSMIYAWWELRKHTHTIQHPLERNEHHL